MMTRNICLVLFLMLTSLMVFSGTSVTAQTEPGGEPSPFSNDGESPGFNEEGTTQEPFGDEGFQPQEPTTGSDQLPSAGLQTFFDNAGPILYGTGFLSGLITTLVVGLLFKRFMRIGVAVANKSPFKTWGIGFGGIVAIVLVVALVVFLFGQIPAFMGYATFLVSGVLYGVALMLIMSFYLSGVFLPVFVGSWIARLATDTDDKAPISWWGIIAGLVAIWIVGGVIMGAAVLSGVLGYILSIIVALVVSGLSLGAVWQALWMLGVKRSS